MNNDAAPPGRGVNDLDHDELALVVVAVEGLTAHLRGKLQQQRAGSTGYHELAALIGRCTTIGQQLRRKLDTEAAA